MLEIKKTWLKINQIESNESSACIIRSNLPYRGFAKKYSNSKFDYNRIIGVMYPGI